MQQNPYSLSFGKEPVQFVERFAQTAMVTDDFFADNPASQVYMITGVRGSGKTVFMTEISKKLKAEKQWIVVELNPERDLLEGLASKLSSETSLAKIFRNASINLSFFGFGMEIKGTAPITDIELALTRMLESLKKNGKRVLVTIDEVVSSEAVKVFASAFQIFIRQDLPLFLLMTGLYENINRLQNEKTLTFLYRAPKIELKPLNIGMIAENYGKNFDLERDKALEMAKFTKGYSFAFQVLGYFTWEQHGEYAAVLKKLRAYLEEFVYEKIWSELSKGDKQILYGIAMTKSGRIREIRNCLELETNQFNPYRKRLIKRGLVSGEERGYVRFTLPFFGEFVLENFEE